MKDDNTKWKEVQGMIVDKRFPTPIVASVLFSIRFPELNFWDYYYRNKTENQAGPLGFWKRCLHIVIVARQMVKEKNNIETVLNHWPAEDAYFLIRCCLFVDPKLAEEECFSHFW